MFPKADPVAGLVRYHTPNVYAAVVAWYDVAPGVAVFLIGQFLISTSRIWCARMGVSLGLRSRLPAWPLSPTADGPAIVVGEVHHPVRAIESQSPEWLTIPERGLSTGVAMFGVVGSGKTSACMHPFARQLLSWHADNPERRPAARVLEVKGDLCHDIRRILRTAVLSGAGGSRHRGRSQLMSPLTNPGRFTEIDGDDPRMPRARTCLPREALPYHVFRNIKDVMLRLIAMKRRVDHRRPTWPSRGGR